ncbi:MAG: hypothetical protein HOW97_09670 [Catenulispora sp.]|nr:hypothetical protein [Catenulispora sp.]
MATTLEVINAAQIAALLNPPMVNLSGAPSVASSGATYFALPMTSRLSGSGNITWSSGTNPSRVTAVVPGTYAVVGTITWPSTLGTNNGRAQIQVNGSSVTNTKFSTAQGSSGNIASSCSGLQVLNAGDYLEIYANQASGATISLTSVTLGVWLVSLATS